MFSRFLGLTQFLKRQLFRDSLLAFVATGLLLYQLPVEHRSAVCQFYNQYIEGSLRPQIETAITDSVEASDTGTSQPTTANGRVATPGALVADQVMDALDGFFCASAARPGWHVPNLGEFFTVLPGAFILALVVTLCFSDSTEQKPAAERVAVAAAAAPESGSPTTEDVLRARALRVAVYYAILSGLATVIVRPAFGMQTGLILGVPRGLAHAVAIVLAAAVAVSIGTYDLAASPSTARGIACRIAARAVFLASVISMCIALPYQFLRPPELTPMAEETVLHILAFRLLVVPLIAGLACAGWITFLRWAR